MNSMWYMHVQLSQLIKVAKEVDVASEFIVVDISKSKLCIRWVHGRLAMSLLLCFYVILVSVFIRK